MTLGRGSYIKDPHHVISYDSRKSDGTEPRIDIGQYCSIAANCTFVMAHHNPRWITTTPSPSMLWSHGKGNNSGFSRGDISIGHDVWIGVNATIMDNLRIGTGAVVAAGAVVTKDVPPYAIVGGNPCRIIRYRFPPEVIEGLLHSQWWDRSHAEIMSLMGKYPSALLEAS